MSEYKFEYDFMAEVGQRVFRAGTFATIVGFQQHLDLLHFVVLTDEGKRQTWRPRNVFLVEE